MPDHDSPVDVVRCATDLPFASGNHAQRGSLLRRLTFPLARLWLANEPLAMVAYSAAIFLGAFLSFQVQPLIGKYVLPWFGGAPAVWTTCLLFFQVLLLAGYAYAHFSSRFLRPRVQVVAHLGLVGIALLTLPIMPDHSWEPVSAADPTWRILGLLAATVGLPYFALSATAPLLQNWFSRTCPDRVPYRLYALSNTGSLLALVSFPVIVETWLPRNMQATIWGGGLVLYFLSCGWAGARVWKSSPQTAAETSTYSGFADDPARATKLLWLLLPACASALLLAITNKICQDVAVIAFLWVLPLALYLLSFIVCFNRSPWYRRSWFGAMLPGALLLMGLLLAEWIAPPVSAQIGIFAAGFFICCMVCHGELHRLKPHPAHLTLFYLCLAAGGAVGGLFVAVISPLIFSDYFELHWSLAMTGGLALAIWARELRTQKKRFARLACGGSAIAIAALAALLCLDAIKNTTARVYRARNFYGVLSVYRRDLPDPTYNQMEMMHGRIAHGMQFLHPIKSGRPTLYYSHESGVGHAFDSLSQTNRHLGIVGLGAGTLAAYAQPGDRLRFYEINPAVILAARRHFTYLTKAAVSVTIAPGDARLSLEREAPQEFDLLVLDAFSSDAIPIHLLTREAFKLYRRHLKAGGLLAAHISNMTLDLQPVLLRLAHDGGWTPVVIEQARTDFEQGVLPSIWVLLSQDPSISNRFASCAVAKASLPAASSGPLWTDDFSALFSILRWPGSDSAGTKIPPLQARSAATFTSNSNLADTIGQLRQELNRNADSATVLNNLAVLLATAPDASLRDGPEAVRLAERATTLTTNRNPVMLTTFAAAYAEAGRFEEAIYTAEQACRLAEAAGYDVLLSRNRQLLEFYRRHEPYHRQEQ